MSNAVLITDSFDSLDRPSLVMLADYRCSSDSKQAPSQWAIPSIKAIMPSL